MKRPNTGVFFKTLRIKKSKEAGITGIHTIYYLIWPNLDSYDKL